MDTGLKDRRWMKLADDREKRQDWVVSGAGALVYQAVRWLVTNSESDKRYEEEINKEFV